MGIVASSTCEKEDLLPSTNSEWYHSSKSMDKALIFSIKDPQPFSQAE
jgi:hypothetical protein